jgi:hypothetical protein
VDRQDEIRSDDQPQLAGREPSRPGEQDREVQDREVVAVVVLDPGRLAARGQVVERQPRQPEALPQQLELGRPRPLEGEPGDRAVLQRLDLWNRYSQLMIQTQAPASAIVATIIAKSCDG